MVHTMNYKLYTYILRKSLILALFRNLRGGGQTSLNEIFNSLSKKLRLEGNQKLDH